MALPHRRARPRGRPHLATTRWARVRVRVRVRVKVRVRVRVRVRVERGPCCVPAGQGYGQG